MTAEQQIMALTAAAIVALSVTILIAVLLAALMARVGKAGGKNPYTWWKDDDDGFLTLPTAARVLLVASPARFLRRRGAP